MDLSLSDTQQQVLATVDRIIERGGGRDQAGKVVRQDGYDAALHAEMDQAGMFSIALDEGFGPLDAALVVERVSHLTGLVSIGATGLVYPMVVGETTSAPVALAPARVGVPFRNAMAASRVLIDGGHECLLLTVEPGDIEPVDNDHAGWQLGQMTPQALGRARSLGPESGMALRNWWRVALACEAVGAMRGALGRTAQYLTEREQFGRPLATFQTLQHRLARLAMLIEGGYWLALEAAAKGAPAGHAAIAASRAIEAAPLVLRETQQMHGAMGFTREYPLHLWTMRLPALQRELGGLTSHARDATVSRYGTSS